jgi:hypothetical protein
MITAGKKIQINRAPVLTPWAVVVAERLGFNHDEALSLGKAVAGVDGAEQGTTPGDLQTDPEGS